MELLCRVLIVDDDPKIRMFVGTHLRARGCTIEQAADGKEALEKVALVQPELVLLDLTLPDLDGLDVLTRLRERARMPVIILSARGSEREKVEALDRGADDYITKPFGIEELLARVRANIRRAEAAPEAGAPVVVEFGSVSIDLASRRVTVCGHEVRLTPIEWGLLRELAGNADKVVGQRELLRRVWGPEYGVESEYLRTFIKQLRKKLEPDPARPRYILTEPGVGYRLQLPQTP